MPQTTNINAYADIKQQLEELRRAAPARMDFDNFAQATVWMARVYKYRALLRERAIAAHSTVPGYLPTTPYDNLILRHDKSARATSIYVNYGSRAAGKMVPLGEAPVDESDPILPASVPEPIFPQTDDEKMLAAALALVRQEGLSRSCRSRSPRAFT